MIVRHFSDDEIIEWLGYDEPSGTVFAWSIHHRYDVYTEVDAQLWAQLCAEQTPRPRLVANAHKVDTDLYVYPSARAVFEAMEGSGRVLVNRGRGQFFNLADAIRPGSTNPDMLPAIHSDEDCDGGLDHAWLLTEVRNRHGITALHAYHARSYVGIIMPPEPLIGRY